MDRLRDKHALITGGTSGIGLETARRFLNEGARVAITGKNPENLETARKDLGREVLVIASDALLSLARTLSGELISRGIRVNAISGGPISTPLYSKLGMGDADLKSLQGQVPAGRFGTPGEIAEAVVYFASEESSFTIGSELVIDGGMSNL
jgi:NAD(P)-dependent dehydrogenase (short-subunit alcohol dehydrogenase family)